MLRSLEYEAAMPHMGMDRMGMGMGGMGGMGGAAGWVWAEVSAEEWAAEWGA